MDMFQEANGDGQGGLGVVDQGQLDRVVFYPFFVMGNVFINIVR
jgi:hypothetical protein